MWEEGTSTRVSMLGDAAGQVVAGTSNAKDINDIGVNISKAIVTTDSKASNLDGLSKDLGWMSVQSQAEVETGSRLCRCNSGEEDMSRTRKH